jgi:PAS domain S-box-containing protein
LAWQDVIDGVPDIVYRYRFVPSPGFDYVSPAVEAITGYSPEDHYADPLLGRRIVHPADLPILEEAAQAPDESRLYRVRWRHRDGRTFATEQRIRRVTDEAGQLTAIVGVCRPVQVDASEWIVDAGEVKVEMAASRALVGSRAVLLTASEHRLLLLLALRSETVSRRELVEHLWGSYHASGEHVVEVHVSRLRRKIERDPRHPRLLLTVRGAGYRLARVAVPDGSEARVG